MAARILRPTPYPTPKKNFTGIDDPYEPPANPEITVEAFRADGSQRTPEEMAGEIMAYLDDRGYLRCRWGRGEAHCRVWGEQLAGTRCVQHVVAPCPPLHPTSSSCTSAGTRA